MTGRATQARSEPTGSLPVFDRLAPAPPVSLVAARIDAHSAPGEVVADLFGRGGWIARAGIDRQRRAISLESSPLTRMLAEVVLRPPDVRHLDAAFQGMAASPRGESSLKVSLGDMYATRCPTCGRSLVADDILWRAEPGSAPTPIAKRYRCTVCRDQRGGGEVRETPLDDDDLARARRDVGSGHVHRELAERFPPLDGADDLVDELLNLHMPRQLVGMAAILGRIDADLRAAPVLAALRLALLHALLPASRLAVHPGRPGALRIANGHVRLPTGTQWYERNPWLAFEDAFRQVRGFVQRLEQGTPGPVQARLGEDLRSLAEGTATALIGVGSSSGLRTVGSDAREIGRGGPGPRIRLVLAQPPLRPTLDRLGVAYHGAAWVLGREAASLVPSGALAGASLRAPWSWQTAALGRGLEAVEPAMARDGRVVLLVDDGAEALVSAVLGGARAGYRLLSARLSDGDADETGVVELLPPNAVMPPGPRTRANVSLQPVPGGAGDPDLVPGRGLFAPPERFDDRPFSPLEAARRVTETAVEMLRARGEPARTERLLGEILVGLDRAGQLRRFAGPARSTDVDAAPTEAGAPPNGHGAPGREAPHAGEDPAVRPDTADLPDIDVEGRPGGATESGSSRPAMPGTRIAGTRATPEPDDPVERLLALINGELSRPTQHLVTEIEPGRWWLGDRADREAAAAPLADRVEWSVFSLLSTAGPLSETAFFERIAALFTGHDLPDETLVRACLESYRDRSATSERLTTSDDLLARSHEHTELLAALADGGHRHGMQVWLGRREQTRRIDGRPLGSWLTERERDAHLAGVSRAVEDVADVDCIWYVRAKVAFLWEVEWTAMLGEPLLRRHARIPPDDQLVRFLVIAPERTELVRHKLARSPLLRAAIDEGPWHIIKSDHLRTYLARDEPDLTALEPLVGLDPLVERTGEQLPLFGG